MMVSTQRRVPSPFPSRFYSGSVVRRDGDATAAGYRFHISPWIIIVDLLLLGIRRGQESGVVLLPAADVCCCCLLLLLLLPPLLLMLMLLILIMLAL